MKFEFFLVDSLQKVFPNTRPSKMDSAPLSVLRGEVPAVQLVYYKHSTNTYSFPQPFAITVEGAPVAPRLRSVELVPADFPCYEQVDDYYITTDPGMFPDRLAEIPVAEVKPTAGQYRAVWIDFPGTRDALPGRYTIKIRAEGRREVPIPNGTTCTYEQDAVYESSFVLEVLVADLPPQKLLHTEWMHADCLADYYGIDPFSEAWWTAVDNFMGAAADYACNMMLTPIFTPALDTIVGGERTTIQLVDIYHNRGDYTFGFEKLERWCGLCKKHGITHIELGHLFSQWGAVATPKVMMTKDGLYKRVFGWDTPATSPAYRELLAALLPALQQTLGALGYDKEHVVFHISDEPATDHFDSYKAAKAQVADLLDGWTVMDALSDFDFYERGLIHRPIPGVDHVQPFLDAGIPGLWVYHCCAQCYLVPNRFYAMPSARNRILGVLMYYNNIKGFLQWGFNFYSSQFSLQRPINPYADTSARRGFPAGDPYLVYPGKNYRPEASIRGEVLRQAFHDVGALEKLEELAGRDFVLCLVMDGVTEGMNFISYPRGSAYLLALRARVNAEIKARLQMKRCGP